MSKIVLRIAKRARVSGVVGITLSITALLTYTIYAQSSGTPSQLRVKTDANNYLILTGLAQVAPISSPTVFTNTRLRTDSNGYLAVVLAGGTISPTTISCSSSIGTSLSVLQGGNPCFWSPAPNVEGFVIKGGSAFTQTGQVSAWSYSTASNQLAIAVNGNSGLTTNGAFILRLRAGDLSGTKTPIQIPNSGSGLGHIFLAQDSTVNVALGVASTVAVTPKFYIKGPGSIDLINLDTSTGAAAFTTHNDGTSVFGNNTLFNDPTRTHVPVEAVEVLGAIKVESAAAANTGIGGVMSYTVASGTTVWETFGKDASTNGLMLFRSRRSDGTNSVSELTSDGAGKITIPTVNASTAFQANGTPINSGTTLLTSGSGMAVANVGANSCGTTTATIAGNNNLFTITVGATAGTQCRVAFTITASNAWGAVCNDDTTTIAVRTTAIDTTHVDVIGTFTAGDLVTCIAHPR